MASSSDTEPDLTLRYADHPCGLLDVHLPPGGSAERAPLLVVVHGGFWKASIDRTHTRDQARALADLGHVVVTPEYRRVPESPLVRLTHRRDGGGGWPTTGDDVLTAVQAAPGLLAAAGVAVTDPPVVVGHSAGGQLVLWLASTGTPLSRVVALAPVCDLTEAVRRDLGGGAAQRLLGRTDPATADPMVLLDVRPDVPVAVVHGRQDAPVPVDLSRGLVDRHPWISYTEIDSDHMSLVDPTSRAWSAVVAAVRR